MSRQKFLFCCALVSLFVCSLAQNRFEDDDDSNTGRRTRTSSKPWYSSDIQFFGFTMPISPVTLIIGILAVLNVYRGMTKTNTAEGSHILMEDDSDATREKMEGFKREIGNDSTKFAHCAKKHSVCPSKSNGGDLGKWKQGTMAPPFDNAVFDPQNSVNTTIGPVKTSFGWHLIYVRSQCIAA